MRFYYCSNVCLKWKCFQATPSRVFGMAFNTISIPVTAFFNKPNLVWMCRAVFSFFLAGSDMGALERKSFQISNISKTCMTKNCISLSTILDIPNLIHRIRCYARTAHSLPRKCLQKPLSSSFSVAINFITTFQRTTFSLGVSRVLRFLDQVSLGHPRPEKLLAIFQSGKCNTYCSHTLLSLTDFLLTLFVRLLFRFLHKFSLELNSVASNSNRSDSASVKL
eukprot:Phypoly_transcript_16931.p1 GENE.Phypoly_transcript_16931~~Phypoly_transcript_16931.p1  ORF type:complete len:222 (-),score=-2.63 Phypoly_transcript_16931:44-709(-)